MRISVLFLSLVLLGPLQIWGQERRHGNKYRLECRYNMREICGYFPGFRFSDGCKFCICTNGGGFCRLNRRPCILEAVNRREAYIKSNRICAYLTGKIKAYVYTKNFERNRFTQRRRNAISKPLPRVRNGINPVSDSQPPNKKGAAINNRGERPNVPVDRKPKPNTRDGPGPMTNVGRNKNVKKEPVNNERNQNVRKEPVNNERNQNVRKRPVNNVARNKNVRERERKSSQIDGEIKGDPVNSRGDKKKEGTSPNKVEIARNSRSGNIKNENVLTEGKSEIQALSDKKSNKDNWIVTGKFFQQTEGSPRELGPHFTDFEEDNRGVIS